MGEFGMGIRMSLDTERYSGLQVCVPTCMDEVLYQHYNSNWYCGFDSAVPRMV